MTCPTQVILSVSMNPAQKEMIERAARAISMPRATFMRRAVLVALRDGGAALGEVDDVVRAQAPKALRSVRSRRSKHPRNVGEAAPAAV